MGEHHQPRGRLTTLGRATALAVGLCVAGGGFAAAAVPKPSIDRGSVTVHKSIVRTIDLTKLARLKGSTNGFTIDGGSVTFSCSRSGSGSSSISASIVSQTVNGRVVTSTSGGC